MITIAIAEDCIAHQKLLKQYIDQKNNMQLLHIAGNGLQAIQYCHLTAKSLPDVMIVDYEMRPVDGLQLTDYLDMFFPEIKVLALSGHSHLYAIENMFACGALGFKNKLFLASVSAKGAFFDEYLNYFYNAVETVAQKDYYLDETFSWGQTVGFSFQSHNPQSLKQEQQYHTKKVLHQFNITKEAYQKFYLYCAGMTVKEIASMVALSENTVDNTIKIVMGKLGARDRHDAILQAYRYRLIPSATT